MSYILVYILGVITLPALVGAIFALGWVQERRCDKRRAKRIAELGAQYDALTPAEKEAFSAAWLFHDDRGRYSPRDVYIFEHLHT